MYSMWQGRCQTPYAEEAGRPPPSCDGFCCAADAEDGGAWMPHLSFLGHKVPRSDAVCLHAAQWAL